MSDIGKLTRGYKWNLQRDSRGELKEEIKRDPSKMCDVEFYLAHLEGRNARDVERAIQNLRILGRRGRKNRPEYERAAGELGFEKDKLAASDGSPIIIYKKKKEIEVLTKSKGAK